MVFLGGFISRILIQLSEKSCAMRLQDGKHTVSKFRGAVGKKVAVEDSKGCNIVAVRNRLKKVSQRWIDNMESLDSTQLIKLSEWNPHTCEEYSITGLIRPCTELRVGGIRGGENMAETPQNT
ncbi:hypothetical protein E2C01_010798 [Portunus trituberculatus]|uniref:Uncharacterized protein n=1 Tax=Portunus trituberculatus TaxID=210409 RepID=A0A5B7D9D6_PORTR|nr:hypothetical protein [Portunus trituberculatus]